MQGRSRGAEGDQSWLKTVVDKTIINKIKYNNGLHVFLFKTIKIFSRFVKKNVAFVLLYFYPCLWLSVECPNLAMYSYRDVLYFKS